MVITQVIVLATLVVGTTKICCQIVSFESNVYRENIIAKEGIQDCDQDEAIRLSGLGLTMIPDHLVKSSTIKNLILNNNELTTISLNALDNVAQLECLNLAGNRLQLETFREGHPRLKKLILDHQRLPESSNMVPSACLPFKEFPNLTSLSLKGLDLHCFKLKSKIYPVLSDLDLSNNYIRGVNFTKHQSSGQLNLRRLYLKQNEFEEFYLDHIGNIEVVYLDKNPLTTVRIHEFNQNLSIMSLADCAMSLVDGHLYAPYLTMLDLSGNRIQELTANSFEGTSLLERLNLDRNNLREFPDLALLGNLKRLSLNFNQIEQIVTKIEASSLVVLSLRGNGISVIGNDVFSKLTRLEELDLSYNRLQTLPIKWHLGMMAMHTLNLEGNAFQNILNMNVHTLYSLKTLRIKENYVYRIDVVDLQILPKDLVLYVF